jgi:PAS domain S-box-containing protein
MLTKVTDAMVEYLDAAFARIWLLEGESELVLRASSGQYTNLDGGHARIRMGGLKIGRIALSRTPHLTNDVMHDPEISDHAWARQEHMVGFAGYPLIVDDRLVGVVGMFSRTRLPGHTLDALGSMAHALAAAVDRKGAEPALGMLAAIVQGAEHAIISSTLDGCITTWNAGAERLYGYVRDEVIGRPISIIVPADELSLLQDSMRSPGAPQTAGTEETRRLRKGGAFVDVAWTVSPIRDRTGRVIALSYISRDITERKRLEQQLREAQKMDAVGRLAGGIAHDFNNLLTIINGYAEALKLLVLDHSDATHMVDQIEAAGARAADLTQQLLSYSRRQLLNPKPVDLNRLVREARTLIARLIGEDIRIECDLDPALMTVRIDATSFLQILINLAVNARDAMPTGGVLSITTANANVERISPGGPVTPAAHVRLTVADTGCGMDDETKQRAFEPFFTTKAPGAGTGLGLAMVYGAINQSGGSITVHGRPGHGCRFDILLPADRRGCTAADAGCSPVTVSGTETVLIVEDEHPLRRLLARSLETLGYRVLEAENGERAAAAAVSTPDLHLLITDVVMPRMGGPQLCEVLRSRFPDMRVLFISGYNEEAMLRYGLEAGTHELLPKPFSTATLAQKVRQVLDAPRTHAFASPRIRQ